jgi:hypothetical protein
MWHSAASSSGFGTPGMENSQYIWFTDNGIQLIDQFLSPDADGNGDVLAISYQFSKPGYLIHAGIYDLNGVLLERPFHITAAGTTGILSWNLVQTNGTILQTGSYIILIEAVHPSGAMMRKKLAFMVL